MKGGPQSACDLVCWFDRHEGAGVWAGSFAGVVVAVVAVGLPFLMRWLDRVDKRQQLAWNSFLAVHHARGALHLIMDLQRELYGRTLTPLNATNRQWDFDFGVAGDAVELAMKAEIRDPALLPLLSAVCAWVRKARAGLELDAKDGLFQLQYSTAAREAADGVLLQMQKGFLNSGTRLFVQRPKRSRAGAGLSETPQEVIVPAEGTAQ